MAPRVGVGVQSCVVVFLEQHFLFTSSDTFADGRIFQPQNTRNGQKADRQTSDIESKFVLKL